eukprot:1608719-Rhodomonas_salina.1
MPYLSTGHRLVDAYLSTGHAVADAYLSTLKHPDPHQLPVLPYTVWCYRLCGTGIAYGATGCAHPPQLRPLSSCAFACVAAYASSVPHIA